MSVSIIAAIGKKGEIGINGLLPWYLPADLKRFKEITGGHTVIMGRKTYESIGKPLPDRINVIITRNQNYEVPGCLVVHSIKEALIITNQEPEVFIIGGAEIFAEALPFVEKMYITAIDKDFPADTFFPELDLSEWKITKTQTRHRPETEHIGFDFLIYERIKNQH